MIKSLPQYAFDKIFFVFVIFLFFLSFLTRFFNLSFPPRVVFDEAHFGLYATKYLSHQYYFDIHPPLGKLLLALGAFFGGIKPGFDFAVNSPYGDFNYLILRSIPAFFGALFPILIYFLVLELGFSRKSAFLASFLTTFENALLVQSRFILLDIILVFFIFLSLFLFLLAQKRKLFSKKWYFFNFLCGLFLGCTISIKLTGFGILATILFFSFFQKKQKKEKLFLSFFFLFLPLFLYFLFYFVHFSLLFFSCEKNCGQVLDIYLNCPPSLFRDSNFCKIFNFVPQGNVLQKFVEVQKYSLLGNLASGGAFYYQADWFSFPFMIRPILYYSENVNEKEIRIYFFGNPFVWWLGTLAIVACFYLLFRNYLLKCKLNLPKVLYHPNFRLLISGYLFYLLPFGAVQRFILMYHYLPALCFSIIIFSVFFTEIVERFSKRYQKLFFFAILFLVFFFFVFFSPFTYGFPLTERDLKNRFWLDTWGL